MRNELKKALSHETWLNKLDDTYVQFVCYMCGTEQQANIATLVSHTHVKCIKCGVKLLIAGSHEHDNGHVKSPRVFDEQSIDTCAACDIDLGTCDTIWAAEGALYCSAECGIHDYETTHVDAEKRFYAYAEEINPQDIGIDRR